MDEEKPKSKKKTIIMMAGGFLLSFLVINVGMYFLLKMTQPIPPPQMAQETQTSDSTAASIVEADTNGTVPEGIEADTSAMAEKPDLNLTALGVPQDSLIPASKVKEMMAHLLKEQDTSRAQQGEVAELISTAEGATDSNQTELKILMAKGGSFDMNRIARLAKIFEAMKPKQAAPVLSQLDNDVIIMILLKMKERPAAKILGEMSVERAASISRQISQKVLES